MYNRAEVVDKNFVQRIQEGKLPELGSYLSVQEAGLRPAEVLDLFESQIMRSAVRSPRPRVKKTATNVFIQLEARGMREMRLVAKSLGSRTCPFFTTGVELLCCNEQSSFPVRLLFTILCCL